VLGYLDPGSSSVVLGVVAGGIAGVGVAAKSAMLRLRGGRRAKASDDAADELTDSSADEVTADDAAADT
jgi:hypothetical protein